MPFKMTAFFYDGSGGWSESWYTNDANLTDAYNNIPVYVTARSLMLGPGCFIQYARVVDLSLPGASLIASFNPPNLPALSTTIMHDFNRNDILVRIQAGEQYRRQMWLRGVPDSFIQYSVNSGLPSSFAAVQQLVNAFIQSIGNIKYGIRCLDKTVGVNTPLPVSAITVNAGDNRIVITTGVNNPYQQGQYVRINKVKGVNLKLTPPAYPTGINGIWPIYATLSNTQFILNATVSQFPGTPQLLSPGYVRARALVTVFPDITDGVVIGYRTHKAGIPFGLPRGRQRAVRRT